MLLAIVIHCAVASKTCKSGMHSFVVHNEPCNYKTKARHEDLGCNIPGSPINPDISKGGEIHWSTKDSKYRLDGYTLPDTFEDSTCEAPDVVSLQSTIQ